MIHGGSVKTDVGVAIIGCGRAGMIHAQNFEFKLRGARVVALSDPSVEQLKNAAGILGRKRAYPDFRDAIHDGDVQAVVIATPTVHHQEIASLAAAAGKHILCEKPLAISVDECRKILSDVEAGGVKLQVGFMRRFDTSFREAKQRIDAGEIGEVVMVRSVTYGPTTPKAWMYDLSRSNGPLAEVNSHDIDTLRWFTGSEFGEVYAIAANYRCPEAREQYPDFYDNVTLTARFRNGCQGCISGAQGVQYGYDSRCEILGTKGIIHVGALNDSTTTVCGVNGMSQAITKSWMDLFERAYVEEDRDFIECILMDRSPRVSGWDGLKAVEVVNAGNQSIRSGKPVAIGEDAGR